MAEDENPTSPLELDGMLVTEATQQISERRDDLDRSTVRSAILRIATDGNVSVDAASDAIDGAKSSLATVKNSLDLAHNARALATEAARGLEDVDLVHAELDSFDSRLEHIEASLTELEGDIESVQTRVETADLLEVGLGIVNVEHDIEVASELIDELIADVETFEDWVHDPNQKLDELEADISQVEELLDIVEDTTNEVRRAIERSSTVDTDTEPLLLWIDASMRTHLIQLLLEDLLSELTDLKTIADRSQKTLRGVSAMATRLEGLESQREVYVDRINRLERENWPGEFSDVLASFNESLEAVSPPIDWGHVQGELQHHRSLIESQS